MSKKTLSAPVKDARVSIEVPGELRTDFDAVREKLGGISKAQLGALALRFVVPRVNAGELVNLNGSLVSNPAA